MSGTPIDVPRLIRIATLLFAVLGGSLVYFSFAPRVDAAQMRLDDDEAELRSQDVALAEVPRLRAEHRELARRYETAFVRHPEAIFLRELASTLTRHGVTLESTSVVETVSSPIAAQRPALFKQTAAVLELRGTYGRILASVRDLSNQTAIVGVDAPTFRRDTDMLVATVPVTLYEPAAAR